MNCKDRITQGQKAEKCRGCQADIYWITTDAGKSMPVNPDGESHFATCPQANRFRKGKKEVKESAYQMIKRFLDDSEGIGEGLVNWIFDNVCRPDCDVQCNEHYDEGPEDKHMIGCFLAKYSEQEAISIMHQIEEKIEKEMQG